MLLAMSSQCRFPTHPTHKTSSSYGQYTSDYSLMHTTCRSIRTCITHVCKTLEPTLAHIEMPWRFASRSYRCMQARQTSDSHYKTCHCGPMLPYMGPPQVTTNNDFGSFGEGRAPRGWSPIWRCSSFVRSFVVTCPGWHTIICSSTRAKSCLMSLLHIQPTLV